MNDIRTERKVNKHVNRQCIRPEFTLLILQQRTIMIRNGLKYCKIEHTLDLLDRPVAVYCERKCEQSLVFARLL